MQCDMWTYMSHCIYAKFTFIAQTAHCRLINFKLSLINLPIIWEIKIENNENDTRHAEK